MKKRTRAFLLTVMMSILFMQISTSVYYGGEEKMEIWKNRAEDCDRSSSKSAIKTGELEKTENEIEILFEEGTGTDAEKVAGGNMETAEQVQLENAVKTGDLTPVLGVFFLAVCSLLLGVEEILRRIKY